MKSSVSLDLECKHEIEILAVFWSNIIFEISLILADKGNLQMHVFRYHSKKNWFITASVLFKESIKKNPPKYIWFYSNKKYNKYQRIKLILKIWPWSERERERAREPNLKFDFDVAETAYERLFHGSQSNNGCPKLPKKDSFNSWP